MLRLITNIRSCCSLRTFPTKIQNYSVYCEKNVQTKLQLKLLTNNNNNNNNDYTNTRLEQWLVTRFQSTTSNENSHSSTGAEAFYARNKRKKDEKNDEKITPLGWFLLIIPITTFGLGCWQTSRKAWKEKLIKDLEELTQMPPVPMPEDIRETANMEYRKVAVRGKFLHDKEMLMGPRSLIRPDGKETVGSLFSQPDTGGNGYLVVTPFQLADRDEIILINRGWVNRKLANPQTRLEGQIDKEVELIGVVRGGEKRTQFTPKQIGDIFLYRDLPKMCAIANASPVFLDATYASSVPGGPIGGQTRVTLRNEHLSYLITWFSLSIATSYLWYRQILKRKPF